VVDLQEYKSRGDAAVFCLSGQAASPLPGNELTYLHVFMSLAQQDGGGKSQFPTNVRN
jgi:hypothetical protein